MHTNAVFIGFPVFLLTVLAACGGGAALAGALLARRFPVVPRVVAALGVAWLGLYGILLLGASLTSRDVVLAAGTEKHICEVDCHLAYRVTHVATARTLGDSARLAVAEGTFYVVTLNVRFDETTTAARRPRGLPMIPRRRAVVVIDDHGRRYAPSAAAAAVLDAERRIVPLWQPLLPAASFATTLAFDLPADARNPRLLIADGGWLTRFVIGHENSFLHGKTLLALAPVA